MKSKVFSSKLLKNNISGGIWVPVLLAIGFFFVFPVAELMCIGNWIGMENKQELIRYFCINLYKDNLLELGLLIIIAAAFLNALAGYFYLYSREKVDFYHSLPVKKSHMFLQKLLMGFVYTVIPYAVMLLLALLVIAIRGYFQPEMLLLAVRMMAVHMLTYLFLYFCFVLVFAMTGTILMGVLSIGGFSLYGPVLYMLFSGYEAEFFKTYSGQNSEWMDMLVHFTPFSVLQNLCIDAPAAPKHIINAIFLTILLGVLAYFTYIRCPSECTGKSIVFPWFALVLKYAIVIPCGLGVGLIMYSLQPYGREFWGSFGILAGTILAKGSMEVLYSFDFRTFLKSKTQTVISLVIVFVIAGIFRFDVCNYSGYLPAYDKLEGINISLQEDFSSSTYVDVDENGAVTNYYTFARECMLRKNEGELGENLYDVLKDIIADNEEGKEAEISGSYQTFKYNLKSGGYAYRNYLVSTENMQKLLTVLLEETNFRENQLSALKVDAAKYLTNLEGTFYDQKLYVLFPNMPEKKQALVDSLLADYTEASAEELLNQKAVARLELNYTGVPCSVNTENPVPGLEPVTTWIRREFYIYPSYERTLALLKETGFPLHLEEAATKEAEVHINLLCEGTSDSYYQEYGPFQITDENELKEIQNCIDPFFCSWRSYLNGVYITYPSANSGQSEVPSYSIPSDQVPECVQKLLDRVQAGEIEETLYE